MQKADALYNDYKYAQAIEIYKPLADKGNLSAIRKIAACYRKINDYTNAEKYYAIEVSKKNVIPSSYLYYGQVLMANEKYEDAQQWLEKYLASTNPRDSTIAKTLLISCRKSKTDLTTERKIEVENLHQLNTSASDFCAVPIENGILFTSTSEGKTNGTSGDAYQQIYIAHYLSDSTFKIESLKGVVNSKNYNSGPACVDTLRDILYFTKNNYQYGDAVLNKKGDVTLKIYSAKKNNNAWKDSKELEFNGKEYSCAFPSINSDGTIIFFTSDRAGGYGGKDIYYSVNNNGIWSKPKNAGNKINTAGDERYPFIHPDGTLYFSSTGLPGFGGMDIYKSVPNKLGEFGNPENLGKPFNSPTDDFGFYLDRDAETGFFSSNRNGGEGSDDIYRFTFLDIPLNLKLYCDGKLADDIHVKIEENGKIISEINTNKTLSILLDTNKNYQITCSKVGFKSEILEVKTGTSKKAIYKSVNLLAK
ncbi:MAG: hypothetical protein R2739_10415 [Chitinophagales bacterium]|nr:PD40 domain-containing protein [Bacteroidota bacterium]